jgi:hypothetical protein
MLCTILARFGPTDFHSTKRRWNMRIVRYLAWAWIIIVGGLMITPGGVWCIACGQVVNAPGYIGQTAVRVVAAIAIVLGLVGIVTEGKAKAASAGAAAGR